MGAADANGISGTGASCASEVSACLRGVPPKVASKTSPRARKIPRPSGDMLAVPDVPEPSSNDEMSSAGTASWLPVAMAAKSNYGSDNLYVVSCVAKEPRAQASPRPEDTSLAGRTQTTLKTMCSDDDEAARAKQAPFRPTRASNVLRDRMSGKAKTVAVP